MGKGFNFNEKRNLWVSYGKVMRKGEKRGKFIDNTIGEGVAPTRNLI